MYTNGKLNTLRGIRKILCSERGYRKGGGRGGGGGSEPRKEKCDEDLWTRSGNGVEKVIREKFEIVESIAIVSVSLKIKKYFFISIFLLAHVQKESRYKM